MKRKTDRDPGQTQKWSWVIVALAIQILAGSPVQALTSLSVKSSEGATLTEYRWLLQEDNTFPARPGVHDSRSGGFKLHYSHAPVVATGGMYPDVVPGCAPMHDPIVTFEKVVATGGLAGF